MAISGFFAVPSKLVVKPVGFVGEKSASVVKRWVTRSVIHGLSTRSVRTRAGPKDSSTNPRALPDPLVLIPGGRRADSSVVCFMAFNLMGFVSRSKVGADHPIKSSGHHHVYRNSASHGATRHAWRTIKKSRGKPPA